MNYAQLFHHIKCDTNWKCYKCAKHETQYAIEVDEELKIIRLLWQESNGKIDWKDNFDFVAKVYKHQESILKAHRGIASAYKDASDTVMGELLPIISKYQSFKVVCSGWSHGGGIAIIASEDINYRTRTNKTDIDSGIKPVLVTFGAPKVLADIYSVSYLRDCCSTIYEMRQYNDIVTHVPWWNKNVGKNKPVGVKYSPLKVIHPFTYHTSYDDRSLYDDYSEIGIACPDVRSF